MDLETIERGYKNKKYTDIKQLLKDIQLIGSNCKKVNEEDSVFCIQQIVEYANIMKEKCEAYLSKHNLLSTKRELMLPSKRRREIIEEFDESQSEELSDVEKEEKKRSNSSDSSDQSSICNSYSASKSQKDENNSFIDLPLVSYRQQIALKEAVMKASIEVLTKIVKIVQKENRTALQTEGDVFKIPVDKLSYNTFSKIRSLLNE